MDKATVGFVGLMDEYAADAIRLATCSCAPNCYHAANRRASRARVMALYERVLRDHDVLAADLDATRRGGMERGILAHRAVRDPRLRGAEMCVLVYLDAELSYSQFRIVKHWAVAEKLHMSRRSVSKAIKRLVSLGYLRPGPVRERNIGTYSLAPIAFARRPSRSSRSERSA